MTTAEDKMLVALRVLLVVAIFGAVVAGLLFWGFLKWLGAV
jgi:hypothetical protein